MKKYEFLKFIYNGLFPRDSSSGTVFMASRIGLYSLSKDNA